MERVVVHGISFVILGMVRYRYISVLYMSVKIFVDYTFADGSSFLKIHQSRPNRKTLGNKYIQRDQSDIELKQCKNTYTCVLSAFLFTRCV